MGAVPAVAAWAQRHPKKSKLQKLYRETGSIVGVGKLLNVSKSTAHIWLRQAGIKLNSVGFNKRRRKMKTVVKRKIGRKPKSETSIVFVREPCKHGRQWGGLVISCIDVHAGVCDHCCRGYDFAIREISTASTGISPTRIGPTRRAVPGG